VVVGAHDDLWSLVRRPGGIDAAELFKAIVNASAGPSLDHRTRLLVHESLEALASIWGIERLDREVSGQANAAALRELREARFEETGFPSLRTHVLEATSPDAILRMLRDLGQRLRRPARITIGGSSSLMLARLVVRQTEDVDVADELPEAIRADPFLVDELAARHKLRLTHFATHYLPDGWEARIGSVGRFGLLEAHAVDPLDVLTGKLFSRRPKDFDDLLAAWAVVDRDALRERVRTATTRLRADPDLARAAQRGWYTLSGESTLP
jgi:hypothetical protein